MTSNNVSPEIYAQKREELTKRIWALKAAGFNFGKTAKYLGVSPSAISDLTNSCTDRYNWSYNRIVEKLNKLEGNND